LEDYFASSFKSIDEDTDNTVFLIFLILLKLLLRLVEAAQDFNQRKNNYILQNRNNLTKNLCKSYFGKNTYRKVAIKDAKLRTLLPKIVVGMI
jgi:ABC-type uncharacterized transport system fused permease/ATPase subunit